MGILFLIPGPLRRYCGEQDSVEISAPAFTLAEALAELWRAYPALQDRVLTEQGEVRQHVNIFFGNNNIRDTGGLSTPVSDGAQITIVPAVSGGTGHE